MTNYTYCDLENFKKHYKDNIHGYLSLTVCILGSIANVFNICVLRAKQMRSPTNYILTGLAVADLLVMLQYIPFTVHRSLPTTPVYYTHFNYGWAVYYKFHSLFTLVLHFIACFLTIILAIWRYVYVSQLHASKLCSDQNRTLIVIVITYLVCPLLCFPMFQTLEIQEYKQTCDLSGVIVLREDRNKYNQSELKNETIFILFPNDPLQLSIWVYSLLLKLLPCILLTILSYKIIAALIESRKRRVKLLMSCNPMEDMSRHSKTNSINLYKENQADRTTKMLLAVLLLFLLTEFPQGILGQISAVYGDAFLKECYSALVYLCQVSVSCYEDIDRRYIFQYMMLVYVNRIIDHLLQIGIKKGDAVWFIDRVVSSVCHNGIILALSYALIVFCSVEVACDLFMLTQNPSLEQIIILAPMFFASTQALMCAVPILIQRYHYMQIYKEYLNLWPLKSADRKSYLEIRHVFLKALLVVVFYLLEVISAGIGYLPFKGLNAENTVWPAIAALRLMPDCPVLLKCSIAFINFSLVFAKASFFVLYGMHLMQLCILYQIQNILLKKRLNNIRYDNFKVSDLLLVDHEIYQKWVAAELKDCIKLDIKLKRLAASIIRYLKVALFFQVCNATVLLTLLFYINVFLHGSISPVAFRVFLIGASSMACLYAYYSEIFYEQISLVRGALHEIPWYTFNKSNRILVIIFSCNLLNQKYINAGGVFDVNYSLLIFVFHKVFNFLTVLSKMMEIDVSLL